MSTSQHEDNDTFKILIATDIHLGFKHMDPVRGRDSMKTFEEVLHLAGQNEVDFVLVGGDLFHENKPPRAVMHGCLQLLRKYCVGDICQSFQILNTDTSGSHPLTNTDNDPNLNISMPVFSIHGNHDEPTGPQLLSALDIIETAGLIRYFGKTSFDEEIRVTPLLLKKGRSKLALYGIGYVRSDKLHQMYVKKAVTLTRPEQDKDDWFNVFVLHQNRVKRPDKSHVEESFIDDFIDLVIWGHEHESKMTLARSSAGKSRVIQPGSTIATEFKPSEMSQKHVGLLTIRGRHCELKPIPLQTVRRLYIETHTPSVETAPSSVQDDEAAVKRLISHCEARVEALLSEAAVSRTETQPEEPLIRIRIQLEQTDKYKTFRTSRFGSRFDRKVANPDTIVAFGRKTIDSDDGWLHPDNPHFPTFTLEKLLRIELDKESQPLHIIQVADMYKAIESFVDRAERSAVKDAFNGQLYTVQSQLKSRDLHTLEAPNEGSSLTDEDNDSVQTDQIAKEIRKVRAEMLAASTATPGSSTHVNPDESYSSGGETDPTRLPISQHEHCATPARPDLETSDLPFLSSSPSEQQSPNSALRGQKLRREQDSFDLRDLPSTSGLTSGPSHARSTSSLPTPSPDRMETTSGLAMFGGDRTNSATSGQDRSSASRPKQQKHAEASRDIN